MIVVICVPGRVDECVGSLGAATRAALLTRGAVQQFLFSGVFWNAAVRKPRFYHVTPSWFRPHTPAKTAKDNHKQNLATRGCATFALDLATNLTQTFEACGGLLLRLGRAKHITHTLLVRDLAQHGAVALQQFFRCFLERCCEKTTILPFTVIKVYSQNVNF